eukprot:TRINITY_DN9104_c0_g1_i1.p1 TRINITY_DN9104_c0_g1~~TRINITY_DN9104_c0_g1_i1.p1  ORF type:complete len:568 (+),score=168.07 TRINITY_DN9104_c0_g1_i1:116-1705(+)
MSAHHVFTVHGTRFELPPRYELARARDREHGQGAQGYGAFGAVCEVWDSATQQTVMVKKVQDIFARPGADTARFVRELRLLTSFNHPGTVQVLDAFAPRADRRAGGDAAAMLNDCYLVTPRYDATLLQVIRSKQVLEKRHVRVFAAQLLSALRYIHDCGVLHTRLCPTNILCDMDCTITIGEFGAAEPSKGLGEGLRRERDEIPQWPEKERSPWAGFDDAERSEVWYKAPEVLLRAPQITPQVDIWSAGLIVAEMLNRRPLFPGTNYIEQLRLITDCFGVKRAATGKRALTHADLTEPRKDIITPDTGNFLGDTQDAAESRLFLLSMAPKGRVPMRNLVPAADKFVIDLIENMLRFAPSERQSAAQLQRHPLFDASDVPRPDEVVIWRSQQQRSEPLGCTWVSSEAEKPPIAAVLSAVAPGSLAEQHGAARWVGHRLALISRGDGTQRAEGPPDKVRDRMDAHILLEEGKGQLWAEEHPPAEAPLRVRLRFGAMETSPIDPGWAMPLHLSTRQQLAFVIRECLARYGDV